MKHQNTIVRITLSVVVLLIIIMLVYQNRYESFVLLGIKIPVLIAVVGIFVAGRYSAQSLQGKLSRDSFKNRYTKTESSLNDAIATQADKIKTLQDDEEADSKKPSKRKTPPKRAAKKPAKEKK